MRRRREHGGELRTNAGPEVAAAPDTIEREDGTLQVIGNAMPLYEFANDGGPGGANGRSVNDAWFVLRPDGSVVGNAGGR